MSDSTPHQPTPPWSERVYRELRAQAARHMRSEQSGHTLQPTALIHEAYLRLAGKFPLAWESGTAFIAAAASTFRRILIDHARKRRALKRRPTHGREVGLDWPGDEVPRDSKPAVDVLVLDEALTHLARVDPRAGRVVELRVFGGLTHAQIAGLLTISISSVEDDWRFARAWLATRLGT